MVARQIRVSGMVQGVGFRAALQAEALRLRIGGWVRNRTDGTVEALLLGSAEAVDSLIAWARHGPPAARVTDVRVSAADMAQSAASRFELRPTV